jgi:hypothetical protein
MKKEDRMIANLLEQLFQQAKIQFGSVIKSRWFYGAEGCPGCGGEINAMKYKRKNALSLNAFIFREHGVLIAYLLCGKCANYIVNEAEKKPFSKTALHGEIEENLKQGYLRSSGH